MATDYVPQAGGGGAVILRSLLGEARDAVVWASPSFFPSDSSSAVPLAEGSMRLQWAIGRRSETVDTLLSARLASELLALADQRHAAALWIVLHGAMVAVAARLVQTARLPVHVTVHDDPVGVALMSKRHFALSPLIQRHLRLALQGAKSVDVISPAMADRYRRLYGIESSVVHRATTGPIAPSPTYDDDATLEVGVLGNTYGYPQLRLLGEALDRAARQVSRRGRLVIIGQGAGQRLQAEFGGRLEVEVTGHLNETQAIERLGRSFCLYLNYPFSRRSAIFRQTSFPTKLTTYLMAARPLLAHAPVESSIFPLKAQPEYVSWWGGESVDEGATRITELWKSSSAHRSLHEAAERVRTQYYDQTTNRRRMFELLDGLTSRR